MVSEVLHDIGIEPEHTELVCAYYARDELHDENFVIEGKTLVVAMKHVI